MPTVTPNSDAIIPQSYESSVLRPVRDSDSPIKAWQKDNQTKKVVKTQDDAIFILTRQVERMRRRILGGSSSSSPSALSYTTNIQKFKISSDGGNVWLAKTWDGTTLGTIDFPVEKPYLLRSGTGAVSSRTIRGTTYSFSYSNSLGYYVRTATFAGNVVERSCIVPDPVNGDVITAVLYGNPPTGLLYIMQAVVKSGGSGYIAGDIGKTFTALGGTYSGSGRPATWQITGVSGGVVTSVVMTDCGAYDTLPSLTGNIATAPTAGSGATFDLINGGWYIDLNNDGRTWAEM